jgi:hypothetical protein
MDTPCHVLIVRCLFGGEWFVDVVAITVLMGFFILWDRTVFNNNGGISFRPYILTDPLLDIHFLLEKTQHFSKKIEKQILEHVCFKTNMVPSKPHIVFPKRSFETPLFYCLLEGLTTSSMPLGFLLGGGHPMSYLFLFYILHALASCSFHLFPSKLTYLLDLSMIDLLAMERGYTKSHNVWMYPCYIAIMFAENRKTHEGLMIRMGLVVLAILIKSFYYICMWLLVLLTFLQSCHYASKKDVFKTTLTHCLLHLYCGVVSYMEAPHYDFEYQSGWTEKFLKYCSYLAFVYYTATFITDKKRQLNCVLTCFTSVVLTPLSLYETWAQFQTPTIRHMDTLQEDMLLFYIAFCFMDMMMGYAYYPEYFKWMEGIFHHVATMMFASYFLWTDQKINFCIGLIEEFSSIFLNLYRLFPHIHLFKKLFHVSFVLFRIVIPTFIMVYLPNISSGPASLSLYGSATILNIYWLFKQCSQKKKTSNIHMTDDKKKN